MIGTWGRVWLPLYLARYKALGHAARLGIRRERNRVSIMWRHHALLLIRNATVGIVRGWAVLLHPGPRRATELLSRGDSACTPAVPPSRPPVVPPSRRHASLPLGALSPSPSPPVVVSVASRRVASFPVLPQPMAYGRVRRLLVAAICVVAAAAPVELVAVAVGRGLRLIMPQRRGRREIPCCRLGCGQGGPHRRGR